MKVLVILLIVPIISNGKEIPLEDESLKSTAQPAQRGQFPWQASIINSAESVFCGGALIATKWVVTGAYCVEGNGTFEVRLGTIKSAPPYEEDSLVITTDKAIIHPDYDDEKLLCNIAVVDLKEDVNLCDYVKTIPLGTETVEPGVSVTLSGWGGSSEAGDISPILTYANLTTISNDQCQKTYSAIPNNALCCDGAAFRTICNGDNGGPLVKYDETGNAVLVGVVSFSTKSGCVNGDPSGYMAITTYQEWILSSIKS